MQPDSSHIGTHIKGLIGNKKIENIRAIPRLRQTRHQNPNFGHTQTG